ncbi:hypothetical protein FB45DRAFT_1125755 [Roridomyces roridus]|uniref:F-box domain-containing protein n=1 Tax=Roridomyces roridus TaxID=1738132 RepID=A0AAD7FT57_9AGAR|nr:hypothetical protein FB45DRAFT_1125755 [Roridomyces roridus]
MSFQAVALQGQIDQASADIGRQKEVLKKLERNKSLLQRQLNDLRDPIARLPLEISSEIFIQSRNLYGSESADDIPMLLLQVCNTWTGIALSTPSLWDKLSFFLPRPESFQHLLTRWFERAGTHLLHVNTIGPIDPGVANVLWAHFNQLGHLELWPKSMWSADSDDSDDESDNDNDIDFHQLFGGTPLPASLPFLHTFTVEGHKSLVFTSLEIRQLLSSSPSLTELRLSDVQLMDDVAHEATEMRCLPNLRRIFLDKELLTFPQILRLFSAPRLAILGFSMPLNKEDNTNFISFLQRSSPPLHTLVIGDSEKEFALFDDITPSVSTTSRLEFNSIKPSFAEGLFQTLGQYPSTFLPNLDTLKLHSFYPFPPSLCRSLLRAAVARRTQLRSIRLTFSKPEYVRVGPPDLLEAFRTLAAESGMDIFFGMSGDGQKNLLSA